MLSHRPFLRGAALVAALCSSSPALRAADLSFLQAALASTAPGGWVKVSTSAFSSAWPTGSVAVPDFMGLSESVAYAWTGFAWDSRRGQLQLFGGGHGNYPGNEVYLWNGADGRWGRGTLPSRILQDQTVMGLGAPQSSHTYQTTTYASGVDRLVVFGGGAYNSGANLTGAGGGQTGPWWWNPAGADPGKVGGADGTGWLAATPGSQSWSARTAAYPQAGQPGEAGPQFINGVSAQRTEGGRDVIYLSLDQNASGHPSLWRYALGDDQRPDSWSRVGTMDPMSDVVSGQGGAAAIDSRRGLFVRTTLSQAGGHEVDLAVWDLANPAAADPDHHLPVQVRLVDAQGRDWQSARVHSFYPQADQAWVEKNQVAASVDYDPVHDQFVFWDGSAGGTVWVARPELDDQGRVKPVWTVTEIAPTGTAQPRGRHMDGVLGKWEYVEELGAFIALDSWDAASQDAAVWLYRPTAAVPEPSGLWLGALGLGVLAGRRRRRRRHPPT